MKIVLLEGLGVANQIIEEHKVKLQALGHTFIAYDKELDVDVLIERCQDADVVMLANMPLPQEVVNKAENLKFINVAFTGVDHIPVALAHEKGIAISNASGYATQAVAELVLGFMIQLLRNVNQTEARCRAGQTKDGLVGNLLQGKTVGIVGAGSIGRRVAALCKVFGTHVIAYNRSEVKDEAIDQQVSLEQLLKEADLVSLHTPLTSETTNLISHEQLALMKESAYLINTARGGVVDSQALALALKEGKIAGAAIDVFEIEPPLALEHPLLNSPKTIVTPHIAFASVESMEQRAEIVFDNLYSFLEGIQKNKI